MAKKVKETKKAEEKVVEMPQAQEEKVSEEEKEFNPEFDVRVMVVDGVAKMFRKKLSDDDNKTFVGRQILEMPIWSLYYLYKSHDVRVSIREVKKVAMKRDVEDLNDGIIVGSNYVLTVFLTEEDMEKPVVLSTIAKLVGDYYRNKAIMEAEKKKKNANKVEEFFEDEDWE